MWRSRFLLMMPLLLGILACSLTASDEGAEVVPTPINNPVNNAALTATAILSQARLTPSATVAGSTNSPATTATNRPPATSQQPACTPRTDWPTYTVVSGDTLSNIARRVNSDVNTLTAANCLRSADSIQVGQALRVPVIPPPATVQTCANQWFFTFDADSSPENCPSPAVASEAAGQNFVGGRVMWYRANPTYQVNIVYVFYNDGTAQVFADTWDNTQPYDDPSIVPPSGFYAPVAGIGKIWREQPGVRDRLGWAYEPESPFPGRRQGLIIGSGTYEDLYIDRGRDNLVFQLRRLSGVNAQYIWEVAGSY